MSNSKLSNPEKARAGETLFLWQWVILNSLQKPDITEAHYKKISLRFWGGRGREQGTSWKRSAKEWEETLLFNVNTQAFWQECWGKLQRHDKDSNSWWFYDILIPLFLKSFSVALLVKNPPANAGDARDAGSIPGMGRPPGGGNDNPLQHSCLENPMDRGAWWAIVHRVAKIWTRLSKWALRHYSATPRPMPVF